jgi:trk system potassium uptake protein TrkH
MSLYRAEFSGAKSEKLKPRIAETALSLYKLYVAFTVAEIFALRLAGMTWFEALCHAFSTLGTGGFSTRNASVGGFHSPAIEWIVIVFMLIAGISFVQHYRLFVERRPRSFFTDFEVRAYLLIAFAAVALITPALVWFNGYSLARSIRGAAFQASSILTTTGFGTENFELWYPLAQMILFGLMFVGGCTGSTAGGIKIARLVLLGRVVGREFRRMVERHGVFTVRLGGRVVPEGTIQSLLSLVYLALVVLSASCLLLAAQGVDVLTSVAASTACMFNIGPGFGTVGPAENYAHLPALSKWVLLVCMVAGRLEFYTLIVILTPGFWKK